MQPVLVKLSHLGSTPRNSLYMIVEKVHFSDMGDSNVNSATPVGETLISKVSKIGTFKVHGNWVKDSLPFQDSFLRGGPIKIQRFPSHIDPLRITNIGRLLFYATQVWSLDRRIQVRRYFHLCPNPPNFIFSNPLQKYYYRSFSAV